jgi:hypothetical protein
MKSFAKNKFLKKILAGFYKDKNKFDLDKEERQMLNEMKKDMFYRTRILDRGELIKAKDKEHAKRLKKQEEALGIRVLV